MDARWTRCWSSPMARRRRSSRRPCFTSTALAVLSSQHRGSSDGALRWPRRARESAPWHDRRSTCTCLPEAWCAPSPSSRASRRGAARRCTPSCISTAMLPCDDQHAALRLFAREAPAGAQGPPAPARVPSHLTAPQRRGRCSRRRWWQRRWRRRQGNKKRTGAGAGKRKAASGAQRALSIGAKAHRSDFSASELGGFLSSPSRIHSTTLLKKPPRFGGSGKRRTRRRARREAGGRW